MLATLKKLGWTLGIGIFVVFVLLAINQTVALYANLSTISPVLAMIVTGIVGVLLGGAFLAPVVILLRLPKTIDFPDDESELPAYRELMKRRLSKNSYVKAAGIDVFQEGNYEKAIELLDEKSRKIIKETAASVFVTTAVSQNGKLDALTVLVTQTRMVWRIAHVYWQRPSLRDMGILYGNVAGTALFASELEDMDISRQIEPVINSLMNSPGRSIPIVGHAAHIITDSLLEGSTNAFLTLRVGIVAQKYCGKTEVINRKFLQRNSFIEASSMLRSIVVKSSGKVIAGVMKALKDTGKRSILSGIGAIGKATTRVSSSVGDAMRSMAGKKRSSQLED